jgi:glycosyltransferase involved in cell wall biosynthesis
MPNTKALCIFTNLLGNKAMTSLLVETLDRLPGLEPTYVFVDVEDYQKFPAPRWVRATNPWQVEFIARQKARRVVDRPFDILLVHGWEMAVALRNLARRMPAAAMMDSLPATVNLQRLRQGFKGWKRSLSHLVHHRAFARAAQDFDFFLPKSSDCAASLQRDYGVDRERCFVTHAPQNLAVWKTGARSVSLPIRLLFVGNDFARKGGDFLLHLYAEYLTGTCSLTIASNDPSLPARKLPPGVQWLRGINREQLLEVYRDSDIFVFPSQQDYAPQVLAEALAVGLPCLVNDFDGATDLVHNGETGFVFTLDTPAEIWAEHVKRLVANPSELSRMSACARKLAEEKLGVDRFEQLIAEVIERLRAMRDEYGRVK